MKGKFWPSRMSRTPSYSTVGSFEREGSEREMEFCAYGANLMSEFVFRLVAPGRLVLVVSLNGNDGSEGDRVENSEKYGKLNK
jgi:hypothetical protein